MSRLRDGEEVGEPLACITCNKPLGVVQRGRRGCRNMGNQKCRRDWMTSVGEEALRTLQQTRYLRATDL